MSRLFGTARPEDSPYLDPSLAVARSGDSPHLDP